MLVHQSAERFAAVAESRGITMQVSVGLGPLAVMGSSEWLDRLLGVLLDNAFKYAPTGGAVGVSVGIDGNRVRLVVEDSGPGIPEDERAKIFDRFHRAEGQGGYGSGLGLAIADAVVRHTHGRWEVSTSAYGGARMAVSWPRALGGSRDQAEPDPAVNWSVPALGRAPPAGIGEGRSPSSGRRKHQLQVAQSASSCHHLPKRNRVWRRPEHDQGSYGGAERGGCRLRVRS